MRYSIRIISYLLVLVIFAIGSVGFVSAQTTEETSEFGDEPVQDDFETGTVDTETSDFETEEGFSNETTQQSGQTQVSSGLISSDFMNTLRTAQQIFSGLTIFSGLITTLVVGLLFRRFMRLCIAQINKESFKSWGIGFGGLTGLIVLGVIIGFLVFQIPVVIFGGIALTMGLLWGFLLILGLSFYLSGVLISVLIGSWVEASFTETEEKAPVSWWSIIVGYIIYLVIFALPGTLIFVSPILGGLLGLIIAVVVFPLVLGGVWQILWKLIIERE